MSYTILAHVATGDVATAALQNQLIDDLAVLKTGIADDGTIFGQFRSYSEKYQTVSPSAGVVTFDLANGNHVIVNVTAAITSFTMTSSLANIATSGFVFPIVLYLKNDGTLRAVTWTINGNAVAFSGGVAPTLTGTLNKYDEVVLRYLAGLAVHGEQTGQNR